MGTVTSIAPLKVGIQNGGEVDKPGCVSAYLPTVGDTVALMRQGQTWLVLGAIATGDLVGVAGAFAEGVGRTTYNGPADNAVIFGGAFVDMTIGGVAATFSFIKRRAQSLIRVDLALTFFVITAQGNPEFAVRVNGVDYLIARLHSPLPGLSVHLPLSGMRLIDTGVAGRQDITLRWRLDTPAGGTGLQTSGNDQITFIAEELP